MQVLWFSYFHCLQLYQTHANSVKVHSFIKCNKTNCDCAILCLDLYLCDAINYEMMQVGALNSIIKAENTFRIVLQ
jgi:hypothetical protein